MDHLHCPLGFLREEARRAAAIELRIALEGIRLRWSRLGQTRYNQAKKTADETWRALNDHIRTCEICRHPDQDSSQPNSHRSLCPRRRFYWQMVILLFWN